LPFPDVPNGNDAATALPRIDAPRAGAARADPCATPVAPVDELPPPSWTAPVESDAVLPPLPPTMTGALALAEASVAPADADGDELTGLD
jgi:hypothetical protein